MGQIGREIVERYFDESKVIEKYNDLINQYKKRLSA